jgi:hypothetical protein
MVSIVQRAGTRALAAAVASAALVVGGAVPASAAASQLATRVFAPVDRPGPALSVPAGQLAKSVTCTANATDASRDVVLFAPGTTLTPQENYGWNWFPAMDKLGWPYCSVTEPNNAMADAQTSAEYVVHAIRHVHAISGRKVEVIGHSQGGTEPRFALRFWPDLRPMVDDYITFAGSNHGTLTLSAACSLACPPAGWQQTYGSNYTRAMNSYRETFPGIAYTNVYTRNDELVAPNLNDHGSTSLHGGGGKITNVAVQDVCPLDLGSEHLAVGTYDPVAYAIAIDALTHRGPAKPARVSRSVCSNTFMPGVDPPTFAADYAAYADTIVREFALYPKVSSEPPLKSYVYANRAAHTKP